MRALIITFVAFSLSACNFDSTLVIETPDNLGHKAEICMNGVVYTVDNSENVQPKMADNQIVVCRHSPTSLEQMRDNLRWEQEGVSLEQTEYVDLF